MCMSNHLLKLCEEFFEEFSPEELEGNLAADEEVEELRELLTDQAENGGDGDEMEVIEKTRNRLALIWSHISKGEKCRNQDLSTHFSELLEHLDYLLEENSPTERDSSWKDEYLINNAEDDFYDDGDDDYYEGDFEDQEESC